MVSLHLNNLDLALVDRGDYGIDSPTQSIMDQQIVSV